jgi:FKBP-type peptidyl-prolyl cis-trans isomerase
MSPSPEPEPEPPRDDGIVEEGDVSPARDGGVIKTVLARGNGWARPEAGDEIFMMYTGTLEDGTVFDSSYDRDAGPFTFKLGSNTVIRGMDITAKSMAKNEKCRVVLAPSYAYGSAGSPPKIPPSATLTFDLHLIDFQSKNDLFGDGAVIMKELEPGAGWERPGPLAYVTVICTASAISATSSASPPVIVYDGTISAMLGAGRLPETWDKVIPDMKSGSKVELVCKAPRLLGSGIPDNVVLPPGATAVKCTLTLVSCLVATAGNARAKAHLSSSTLHTHVRLLPPASQQQRTILTRLASLQPLMLIFLSHSPPRKARHLCWATAASLTASTARYRA